MREIKIGSCAFLLAASLWQAIHVHADVHGQLALQDGSRIQGVLQNSQTDREFQFQSEGFLSSFLFSKSAVAGFTSSEQYLRRQNESPQQRILLRNADFLDGKLIESGPDTILWFSEILGNLIIPTENVAQVFFPQTESSIFFGPRDISDWQTISSGGSDWVSEAGSLKTSSANAAIYKSFHSLAKVQIHLRLSWENQGDFLIALGTSDLEADISTSFRMESWTGELVAQRETATDIDLFSIQTLKKGPSAIDLRIELDQNSGVLTVSDSNGKKLGSLKVPSDPESINHGILIKNKSGDLSIDRLTIIPTGLELKAQQDLPDGFLIHQNGELYGLDNLIWQKETNSFSVSVQKDNTTPHDSDESETPEGAPDSNNTKLLPITSLQLIFYHDFLDNAGTNDSIDCYGHGRISGDIETIVEDTLQVRVPWTNGSLRIPLSEMNRLRIQPDKTERPGESRWLLELPPSRMVGMIDGISNSPDLTTPSLLWKPQGSKTSSAFKPGTKAYLTPRNPGNTKRDYGMPDIMMKQYGLEQTPTDKAPGAASSGYIFSDHNKEEFPHLVLLKTGEVVPCKILSADLENVSILTFFNKETIVSMELIRSLEFDNNELPEYLAEAVVDPIPQQQQIRRMQNVFNPDTSLTLKTRDNLDNFLTLTRSRKYLPPTHLLRSKSGDLLKINFLSLDKNHIQFELNDVERQIPRQHVSSISPLKIEELPASDSNQAQEKTAPQQEADTVIPKPDSTDTQPGTLQLKFRNNYHINIFPVSFDNNVLVGTSRVLGECEIPALLVESISLKPDAKVESGRWPYLSWTVHHAQEPIAAKMDPANLANQPQDPMVGQTAPDFNLRSPSGDLISLEELRGKIVILDFWASWCGPCMVSLPDIIQSSASFPDQDVMLLGVNLRESTEVIQKTLKQRNLALQVAMDLNGSIAEKYNASSIPRTIIVDREGIIRWGHTGSSPGLGQEITRVVDALIKGLPLDVQSVEGVGADAPHFSTRLLDGTPFSLEQLTGKVTILDFWATWCGPCIQAMPELIETVQSFDKEKVSLIAVNQGQSTQIINDFIKRKGWDLTVALDMDQSIGKSFKVNAIPHTVIIGTDGKIQHIQIGYRNGLKDSLTRQIQRLLE